MRYNKSKSGFEIHKGDYRSLLIESADGWIIADGGTWGIKKDLVVSLSEAPERFSGTVEDNLCINKAKFCQFSDRAKRFYLTKDKGIPRKTGVYRIQNMSGIAFSVTSENDELVYYDSRFKSLLESLSVDIVQGESTLDPLVAIQNEVPITFLMPIVSL